MMREREEGREGGREGEREREREGRAVNYASIGVKQRQPKLTFDFSKSRDPVINIGTLKIPPSTFGCTERGGVFCPFSSLCLLHIMKVAPRPSLADPIHKGSRDRSEIAFAK